MGLTTKQWAGALAATVIIGMGSTVAFAATNHQATTKSPKPSYAWRAGATTTPSWHHGHGGMMGGQLADVAKVLNLSTATLRSDLKAGQSLAAIAKTQGVATSTLIADLEASVQSKLTSMVTSGKITSAQEQKMVTRIDQRITNFVNGTMPKWGGPGHAMGMGGMHGGPGGWTGMRGMHRGMMGGQLADVAKVLNLSTATLRSDMKAGQSLAAIAQTKGVAAGTLIADLEASAQSKLTSMVTSGKITSTQEQKMVTRIDQRITNFVNGTMPKWGNQSSTN